MTGEIRFGFWGATAFMLAGFLIGLQVGSGFIPEGSLINDINKETREEYNICMAFLGRVLLLTRYEFYPD